MKKLEKLRLDDFPKICNEDQKSILGGSGDGIPQDPEPTGFTFICVNGLWGYCPGEVTIYGSAPGYLGNLQTLESLSAEFGEPNLVQTLESILASGAGTFLSGGLVGVFLAGAGIGETISSYSDNVWQTKLDEVIWQITNSLGFDSSQQLRYSMDNNMVKVWNAETGELLGESNY